MLGVIDISSPFGLQGVRKNQGTFRCPYCHGAIPIQTEVARSETSLALVDGPPHMIDHADGEDPCLGSRMAVA